VSRPDIVLVGDSSVLVEFEARIDPAVNERVLRFAERVRTAALAGVRDVVPTFRSVAVYFDPLRTHYEALVRRLDEEAAEDDGPGRAEEEPLAVPVCYGGEFGPDLDRIATHAGLAPEDVIARHAAVTYRVFMLGFLPGFAYMGLLDARIATPRHGTPRLRVARGSVGIAGRQTGIYPADTPGGWQILGRTPLRAFDLARPSPFSFKAGDHVRFVPVSAVAYGRLLDGNAAAAGSVESAAGDAA
jgi:KipI family sensor histidine kinase inhibitor